MPTSLSRLVETTTNHLREEYQRWSNLLHLQPIASQHFLEDQARVLAVAIVLKQPQARFSLPATVVVGGKSASEHQTQPVPHGSREQLAGGLMDRLIQADFSLALRHRLAELEQSAQPSTAIAAGLIRLVTALHMVRQMVPVGQPVQYAVDEGEEIPSLPLGDAAQSGTAHEGVNADATTVRGEAAESRLSYAQYFYQPQWVAFDDQGNMLARNIQDAEAHVSQMQRLLTVLHGAVSLAPYMVADQAYQIKRYGLLGQLANQGRALARFGAMEIITEIKHRAEAQDLNRGLSLSLPYFDDQMLQMKALNFEVIPAGRIHFVAALVVRAAEYEQAKVAQDTRLSASTRKHLLLALRQLSEAFAVQQ